MKSLKDLFENYSVPVDETGWNAIANNEAVKRYNRGRKLRRTAFYGAAATAVVAIVVTAVMLTRTHSEPSPAKNSEVAQVVAPTTSSNATTPAQTATVKTASGAKATANQTEVTATKASNVSMATENKAEPASPVVPISAQKPAASAEFKTIQQSPTPESPTTPSAVTPAEKLFNPDAPVALSSEPDTNHPQQPQIADKRFFAPNAFSPNGDGVNDIFYVYANTEYTDFELNIYSRNGDHVFQSRQIENGWDGRRKGVGEVLPQGVYVYIVKYRTADHKSGVEKGQILLIR